MTDRDLLEILLSKIISFEAKMATKDDLVDLEARLDARIDGIEAKMATKDDLAALEARMETRMAGMETRMSGVETRMATKEDIADLPYIKQAILDSHKDIMKHSEQLQRIEERLGVQEEIIFRRIK